MNFIRMELSGWKKREVCWLLLATAVITGLSVYWKETAVGILSATTGVICVVLTGKGKLSCYLFGSVNCIAYAYIAYQAKFYGDVMENLLYSLPMQFIGFYNWNRHMDQATHEVVAEQMSRQKRMVLFVVCTVLTVGYGLFLKAIGGNLPFLDSLTNVMSLLALYLSVRRYMEQWILWIIIDVVTVYMWAVAFMVNQESLAALLMWSIYLVNAVIMFVKWYKSSSGRVLEYEV